MKNLQRIVSLMCLATLTLFIACDSSATKTTGESTTAESEKSPIQLAAQEVKAGTAILLDVREQSEWDNSHFVGAVLAPRSKIDADAKFIETVEGLDKTKKIYTHCMKGKRASMVAETLKSAGYNVVALENTYDEIAEGGFEIEKK